AFLPPSPADHHPQTWRQRRGVEGPDSIDPPSEGGCQEDSGEIDIGPFVIPGCDASEVLKAAEHAFDKVTQLVGFWIVGVWMLAGRIWRDDGFDAAFCQPIAQAPCVISAISQQAAGQADCRQEFIG